jgi:glycosyltransferase involved in cell wall biosynthesis
MNTEPRIKPAPLVSVVVIFLNEADFIREAIESVFAQTYPMWELLLIDDGSTDDSTRIAQDYSRHHPDKVRYLDHKGHANRGTGASRNVGISHAVGAYIAFLDADDVWFPYTLEEQVRILEATPEVAMVYGPLEWWHSWTGHARDARRDYVERLGVPENAVIPPPTLVALFLEDKAAVPSGFLVRRETLEAVGEIDEAFRSEYEDQVLCVKICLKAPVFAAGRSWYRYRRHPDSCVAVGIRTGETHRWRMVFLDWVSRYLSEQSVDDPRVWRALRRESWKLCHPVLDRAAMRLRQLPWRFATMVGRRLPVVIRRWLASKWLGRQYIPPPGWIRFGSLRRVTPISRRFGYDRGQPIDRYYIERFLEANKADIRASVLEIGDDTYTRRFGAARVTRNDVLDVDPGNPRATIVADLAQSRRLPEEAFDCVIFTQTLLFIYEAQAALAALYRMLKPGGVILATVPGISQISRYEMDQTGDYWRFTTRSAQRLCESVFDTENVEVTAYGNVLAASAFLFGLASHELTREELDYSDPDYQLLITVRIRKPEATDLA